MSKAHIIPPKAPMLFGVTRAGQSCSITVDRKGTSMPATYLGSGRFTAAFNVGKDVMLYSFHGERSKSIMAQAHRECPSNPHLPHIQKIGSLSLQEKGQIMAVTVYRAKRYGHFKLKEATDFNRTVVGLLQEAQLQARKHYTHNIVKSKDCVEFNEHVVNGFADAAVRVKGAWRISEALETLAQCAIDWGEHYIFDSFSVKNLGVNGTKLVLLDAMFCMDLVQRDYDARKRHVSTAFIADNMMS